MDHVKNIMYRYAVVLLQWIKFSAQREGIDLPMNFKYMHVEYIRVMNSRLVNIVFNNNITYTSSY